MIRTSSLGLANAAFALRIAPFLAAGLLAAEDVHVVDLLARRAPAADVDALLGMAFAIRAPRQGSAGVDLKTLARELGALPPDCLLPDPEVWTERVRAEEILVRPVRDRSAEDPRPFVHDGHLLLMQRYARHQETLAGALLAREGAPAVAPSPRSHAAARATVDRLFARPAREGGPASNDEDRQRLAVETSLERRLLLLCGGPGTGKTHTLRGLLLALRSLFQAEAAREPRIALAAPTGKAAVRMTEVLHAAGNATTADEQAFLRTLRATTLHGLLRMDPARPTRFRHGAENPLHADVVVVDEASMIDLALMAKLAVAVPADARLVLLGDRRQLASVEAGSILADLTSARAQRLRPALVELERVHRTREGTQLALLGARLTRGTLDDLDEAERLLSSAIAAPADLLTFPHASQQLAPEALSRAAEMHRRIVTLVQAGGSGDGRARPQTSVEAAASALEQLGRFRVLTPHREGSLGVRGLNERFADDIRPAGAIARDGLFPGVPVLVQENRRDLGLANGDVGVLCEGPGGRAVVAFPALGGEGPPRFVDRARLPAHEPCWAMTVHKSQGSQYEEVLLVLADAPSRLVTRELVYTALTRARERFVLAGSPAVFRAALDRRIRRASSLVGYLV